MNEMQESCIVKFNFKVNATTCEECGGRCCKNLPGCAFPDDFPTKESLQQALESGRWAIDWWEGDPREGQDILREVKYVRPAIQGHEGQRYHPAWGGPCTFLTDTGCELAPFDRPKECRYLMPMEVRPCKNYEGLSKRQAAIAWLSRSEELE